jgi:hypothetical protein
MLKDQFDRAVSQITDLLLNITRLSLEAARGHAFRAVGYESRRNEDGVLTSGAKKVSWNYVQGIIGEEKFRQICGTR